MNIPCRPCIRLPSVPYSLGAFVFAFVFLLKLSWAFRCWGVLNGASVFLDVQGEAL